MLLKHVGKHGDRKIVVIHRKAPNEDHMALVAYTESLPTSYHDAIMQTLESNVGQTSKELADPLFRALLPDGRPLLESMYKEGMVKKVQTSQVILTPNAKTAIRLDELNESLDAIEAGGAGLDKLRELDANSGLIDPSTKQTAEKISEAVANNVLDDNHIAADLMLQSEKMIAEAEGLLAEGARLREEAYKLNPSLKPKRAAAKKKAAPKKVAVKAKA